MSLTKGEKGISGRMRIAAFLQSVDAGYFEAVRGTAVDMGNNGWWLIHDIRIMVDIDIQPIM